MNETKQPYSIDDLVIGMSENATKTISVSDVEAFAELSGDKNPVHLDEAFANQSRYKARIAHGLFSASFFSALFGTKLPGTGCVYAAQSLRFRRPVFVGDTVVATIEIIDIDRKKSKVYFRTVCKVREKIVIDGEAEIFIP